MIAGARPADRFVARVQTIEQLRAGGSRWWSPDTGDPCTGRHCPDHTELVALGTKSIAEVRTMLAENLIVDEVAAATYQAYRATRDRISVVLVSSGIDSVEAKRIGAYACTSLGEALGIAQGLTTGNDIGILPYGADVIIEISK